MSKLRHDLTTLLRVTVNMSWLWNDDNVQFMAVLSCAQLHVITSAVSALMFGLRQLRNGEAAHACRPWPGPVGHWCRL